MLTCPVCTGRSIRRSARRNFKERLWSIGGRLPYRCYECETRFFAFRVEHDRHRQEEVETGTETTGARHEDGD